MKEPRAKKISLQGSTEIWTRIAGFKVQSANRYTIEPIRFNTSYILFIVFLTNLNIISQISIENG